MKTKYAWMALAAAASFAFVSCQDDFDPTARTEAFNSAFIKDFGMVDPAHDWNMAVSTDISINLGDKEAKLVKVYGNIGDNYYLLARLTNVKGAIEVPVDISQATTDIVVRVDGKNYTGTPGQIIDCTGATSSRAMITDGALIDPLANDNGQGAGGYVVPDDDKLGNFNPNPGSVDHRGPGKNTVTVSYADNIEYFNAQQMAAITATENWTKYITLNATNAGNYRQNPKGYDPSKPEIGAGILPEDGRPNQGKDARPDGASFQYNFTIEIPVEPFYENATPTNPNLQPGEFVIYPYYYGTNKLHNFYLYFVDDYNTPTEMVEDPATGRLMPKLYPIFQDSNGDDLQIVSRPLTDIKEIEGVAVYEFVLREPEELNSYENIGRRLGEFIGDEIKLAPNEQFWIIPIAKRTDGTRVSMDRFLETTTFPRMVQGSTYNDGAYNSEHLNENNYFEPGRDPSNGNIDKFKQWIPMSKRGLTTTGNAGDWIYLQIALQNHNGTDYDGGVRKNMKLTVASDGLTANNGYTEPTSLGTFVESNISNFQTAILDKINAYKGYTGDNAYTKFKLSDMEDEGYNTYMAQFFADFKDAYDHGQLTTASVRSYDDAGTPTVITVPNYKRYDLTIGFNYVENTTDIAEGSIMHYDNEANCYVQFYAKFNLKSGLDPITTGGKTDPSTAPSYNVYSPEKVRQILDHSQTGLQWRSVNVEYNDYRPFREESSSYYTEVPMLCRSHGYKIKVEKDGKPYVGRVGLALWNRYMKSPDPSAPGNAIGGPQNPVWGEFYTYSQKFLNRYEQQGSTYEYSYAVKINHPVSGRQFFAFEDWEITNPTRGDYDINDRESTYEYVGWNWSGHDKGDYSSDRDYNDLIFRLEGAKLADEPEDRPIVLGENTIPWVWCLEDLGSTGDFDFNDLVVRISSYTFNDSDGNIKKDVTFAPMAAGGTMHLYIHVDFANTNYGNNGHVILSPTRLPGETAAYPSWAPNGYVDLTADPSAFPTGYDATEYHRWFGIDDHKIMINTGAGEVVDAKSIGYCRFICGADEFTVNRGTLDSEIIVDAINEMFYVTVNGPEVNDRNAAHEIVDEDRANDVVYKVGNNGPGRAAQSFIISKANFVWAREYVHITNAYPDFPKWVSNYKNNTWLDNRSPDPRHYYRFTWPAMPNYNDFAPGDPNNTNP